MKEYDNDQDIPKAVAEGDKLPEDNKAEQIDPMNKKSGKNDREDAPDAVAEGDKLPEK